LELQNPTRLIVSSYYFAVPKFHHTGWQLSVHDRWGEQSKPQHFNTGNNMENSAAALGFALLTSTYAGF
jgi:hypothetical protein